MKVLWLQCPCGRNLATVHQADRDKNPTMTRDALVVSERPNVRFDEYRPWPHHGGDDPRDVTYVWSCLCGKPWERRHETISAMWAEELQNADVKVVRVLT